MKDIMLNITDLVADLLVSADENLPLVLCRQYEDLKTLKCKNPEIGKWLEDFEMPVLIEILNSSDQYFFESFPEMKTFDLLKRREFSEEIKAHAKDCERCKTKILQDLDWKNKVDATMSNHKQKLKESLKKEDFFAEINN